MSEISVPCSLTATVVTPGSDTHTHTHTHTQKETVFTSCTGLVQNVLMCVHSSHRELLLQNGTNVGVQNPSHPPRPIHFSPWYLVFVGPQCCACWMSHFWYLEFWGCSSFFGEIGHRCTNMLPKRETVNKWYEMEQLALYEIDYSYAVWLEKRGEKYFGMDCRGWMRGIVFIPIHTACIP
jgi:hypothetical protein